MTGPVSCRLKTVPELQAWRVTADNYLEVAKWASAARCVPTDHAVLLPQDTGTHTVVAPGDYVMRGITGRFFRCTVEEFAATYEVTST